MRLAQSLKLILPLLLAAGAALAGGPALGAPQGTPAPLAALPAPILPDPADGKEDPFAEARTLLAEGKTAEASAAALDALRFAPYSTDGYQLLYDCAAAQKDDEGRLRWGKWLFWSHLYTGDTKEANRIAESLGAIWDGWNKDGQVVEEWRSSVEKAIRSAAGAAKQYRLAGHLYGKLLDLDPGNKELSDAWDRLVERAGASASGGAFVADRVRRRSATYVADQNRKHGEWANCFNRKTGSYEVLTNVSYEFFETVSVVMEEMNDFYREIYGYNKKAPRLTLAICKDRVDFDKYCQEVLLSSLPGGVLGWFWDQKLTVAAYDLSGDASDLSMLWSTLFHEASHHFTHLMTERARRDPPTWVNEGTASYFEGCELKADGSIVKNKPAMLRVREWAAIESGRSRHTLKELITVPHRGYDGSYYSYGWSLVYFLLNYEENDPRLNPPAITPTGGDQEPAEKPIHIPGDLVYRDAYQNYYRHWSRRNDDDAWDVAFKYFVEDVDDPEIKTRLQPGETKEEVWWTNFESRWRRFTQAVVREVNAGSQFAEVLLARCRGYLKVKDYERALIAAEQADDKRPNDRETYRLLALANKGMGRDGDAVYWMVRNWELAWLSGDEGAEDRAAAEAWLKANDGEEVLAGYCDATRQAVERIEEAMDDAVTTGHPVLSMLFASHVLRAIGMDHEGLMSEIREMGELSGHDLRLWIRAYGHKTEEDNVRISGVDAVRFDPDGVLVNCRPSTFWTWYRCDYPILRQLAPPFEMRATVQVDGRNGAVLPLGISPTGQPGAALLFRNGADVQYCVVNYDTDISNIVNSAGGIRVISLEHVATLPLPPMQKIPFHLSVDEEGKGEITVGEHKRPIPEEWTPERITGAFAIGSRSDTVSLYQDVEVRPDRPFWPVPSSDEG